MKKFIKTLRLIALILGLLLSAGIMLYSFINPEILQIDLVLKFWWLCLIAAGLLLFSVYDSW